MGEAVYSLLSESAVLFLTRTSRRKSAVFATVDGVFAKRLATIQHHLFFNKSDGVEIPPQRIGRRLAGDPQRGLIRRIARPEVELVGGRRVAQRVDEFLVGQMKRKDARLFISIGDEHIGLLLVA